MASLPDWMVVVSGNDIHSFITRLNGSGLRMRRHSLNHISDQIRNEVASKRYQRGTLILKCMSWDLRRTACDLTPDIRQFTVQPHTTLSIVAKHVHQGPRGGQSSKCHTLICDWDHNLWLSKTAFDCDAKLPLTVMLNCQWSYDLCRNSPLTVWRKQGSR